MLVTQLADGKQEESYALAKYISYLRRQTPAVPLNPKKVFKKDRARCSTAKWKLRDICCILHSTTQHSMDVYITVSISSPHVFLQRGVVPGMYTTTRRNAAFLSVLALSTAEIPGQLGTKFYMNHCMAKHQI